MITTRTEKLEQLLTENSRQVLAQIDTFIQSFTMADVVALNKSPVTLDFEVSLDYEESNLVEQIVSIAGWDVIFASTNTIRFYI